MSAVVATRIERLRDVEAAVRVFRWVAVVFVLVQVGVFYEPPAGVEVPFSRWTVAIGIAAALVLVNVVSRLASRSDSLATMRVIGVAQLVWDIAVAFTLLAFFSFDLESRIWPLFVLPVLEGAMREQMGGAILTAAGSTALVGWHNAVLWADPIPIVISASVFQGGVLVTVALGAGALARRFEHARAIAEEHATRLRELAEGSRQVTAQRRHTDLLDDVVDVATRLTGAEHCAVYLREDGGWELRAATGEPGDNDDLLAGLPPDASVETVEIGPSGGAGSRIVGPIVSGERTLGLLVLGRADRDLRPFTPTDHDILQLLAAQTAIAIENVRVAEAEARTIEELRALDALKDEFVSILAHELRGPMSTMRGYADLLRRKWNELEPERREEFLRVIENGTERLGKLVLDVQQATDANRDALPNEPRAFDLVAMIEEIAVTEVGSSDAHTLEMDVASGTPQVYADPDRTAQVIQNLISNAVKYSPDGGPVQVRVGPSGSRVMVAVADEGIGVPRHLQHHLFQKFSRLPTPKKIRGTGLGLYVTKKLVEAMNGTITVESEDGRGSTFTFTLPAAADAGDSAGRAEVDDVAGAQP